MVAGLARSVRISSCSSMRMLVSRPWPQLFLVLVLARAGGAKGTAVAAAAATHSLSPAIRDPSRPPPPGPPPAPCTHGAAECLPSWKPTWHMRNSTVLYTCDSPGKTNSGLAESLHIFQMERGGAMRYKTVRTTQCHLHWLQSTRRFHVGSSRKQVRTNCATWHSKRRKPRQQFRHARREPRQPLRYRGLRLASGL